MKTLTTGIKFLLSNILFFHNEIDGMLKLE